VADAETLPRKCPTCGQAVDPDDPSTVTAYEQVSTATFGEPQDTADGFKYDFHPACFPDGSPMWRRADD
jgi:hypothetical protein